MSLLNRRFALVAGLFSLGLLAGCGNSSNKATPPPGGGFDNTVLNGTYVFSTSGTDVNGASIFIAGAFTACGCSGGTISGGSLSFGDGSVGVVSDQAITDGSYHVTVDGRGQGTLRTSSALGNVGIDFVLASGAGGSVTEYDNNGTGSGTMALQTAVSQGDLEGDYAFSLTGASATGLLSSAGAFSLDATGAVVDGVQDIANLNINTGVVNSQTTNISTTSTVLVGTGTTPGTAQIHDVGGSTFSFDVYPVSPDHLKFIETDGLVLSAGDVFLQNNALPTGTLAFTLAGLDTSFFPLAAGGVLPLTGGSISSGTEDYDDGGTVNTSTTVGGGFTALSGGRSLLTLSGFENGATNLGLGTYTFAAYPSIGGTLLVEVDNAGITAGVAMPQTVTAFASSQGYGLGLSAINFGTNQFIEEDDIAEFTATTTGFNGLIDFNDEGSLTFNQAFSGTYSNGSTGRFLFSSSTFNGAFYPVDGSTVLFLEADSNQAGIGSFQAQSGTTSAKASLRPVAAVRVPTVRPSLKQAHPRLK